MKTPLVGMHAVSFWSIAWPWPMAVGAGVTVIPMLWYLFTAESRTSYESSALLTGALTAGIAALAVLSALSQYQINSQNARIERAMSFWARSNTREFTRLLDQYTKLRSQTGDGLAEQLTSLVQNEGEAHGIRPEDIEYILDFYDEACTAVMMGATDENALYFYLGPLMQRHAEELQAFIKEWRKKYGRQEKWDCFVALTETWKNTTPDRDAALTG